MKINIIRQVWRSIGNALTSYLVCKTMSDENSFKHNEQTSRCEEVRINENSIFHASKFDSCRLNQ